MKNRTTIISYFKTSGHSFQDRLDRMICHPAVGIPLFLLTVFAVFYLSFSGIGAYLTSLLERICILISDLLRTCLLNWGVKECFVCFLIDGVFLGVFSVIAFLPQTVILFFLIAVLVQSGYAARAAFVMDTVMRAFSLSGRSMQSFLIAFGCSAHAVEATKCLDEKEKENAVCSLLFLPCSARLPVLIFLVTSAFNEKPALAAAVFYIFSLFTAMLSASLYAKKNGKTEPFILSLPDYQIPRLRSLLRETATKAENYLTRACTVIFLCSVFLNLAGILTPSLHLTGYPKESLLLYIGNALSPLFRLLGFENGAVAIALFAGFFAKEAIVSALTLLLPSGLDTVLSPAGAVSLCAFAMLYTPCLATLQAIKKEFGVKKAFFIFVRTFFLAASLAFILYTLTYLYINCCTICTNALFPF